MSGAEGGSKAVLVRPAQASDAPSIAGLVGQLAASSGERSPVNVAFVLRCLNGPASGILIAEVEGEAVGMLSYTSRPSLYHAADSCMIEELVVSEGHRRAGIGSRLLDAVAALAREKRCAEVSVSAMASNTAALDFYRRNGFEDEAVLLERHL
jgi:ribosomal protein S18 acetylase RimI-like enzyme